MDLQWGNIIATFLIALLSSGGVGWIFTTREDKRAKRLENKQKELDIAESKKDNVIQDWKDIAEERKSRCVELENTLKEKQRREDAQNAIISDLRSKLDEKNTYCAVAELMRCEVLPCEKRKPPFGMRETKVSDSFIQTSPLIMNDDK